jgi:transketolase
VRADWRAAGARGRPAREAWAKRLAAAAADKRLEFERVVTGRLAAGWDAPIKALKKTISAEAPKLATRQCSGNTIEALLSTVPELLGGSADLTGSNNTKAKAQAVVTRAAMGGSYIHYGVREHGMAAAMNGIALHGGFIPYGGTFLVFTDYARPSIRLSALMGLRVVYVMTHDSIGLGEDGPTHQPVEHVASLRAMPNLLVFRPADGVETAECWALALENAKRPSVLALTRQGVPTLRTAHRDDNLCARGAYELLPATGAAKATLFATGSELSIAVEARKLLEAEGIGARVVSVPCMELFAEQPDAYRREVIGAAKARVAVEAGVRQGWDALIGAEGGFVGMAGFGASAPAGDLYKHFGITPEAVAKAAKARI